MLTDSPLAGIPQLRQCQHHLNLHLRCRSTNRDNPCTRSPCFSPHSSSSSSSCASSISMFLFRDLLRHLATTLFRHRQSGAARNVSPGTHLESFSGLDPAILSSFPTLPYSVVRGLQEGKCRGVECAVCLSEFNGDDVIRLLTVCCHVFHLTCIDSWLALNTTCPVCRSDLEAEPDEAAVLAVREVVGEGARDSHVIVVEDEMKGDLREDSVQIEIEETREGQGKVEEERTLRMAEPP